MRRAEAGCLLVAALLGAACTARPVASLPTPLRYPDFVYPAPAADAGRAGGRIAAAWRLLQGGDAAAAERDFGEALRRRATEVPAHTGLGWVALARMQASSALTRFDAALERLPRYVPALVGRGQALLGLGRETEALTALEQALALDGSLTAVRGRVDLLRFRTLQDVIAAATSAAAAGRLDAARAAYRRALEAAPDSAFLHRDLGIVERRAGNAADALNHQERARALDPNDAVPLLEIGELRQAAGDHAGAVSAFREAAALDPGPDVAATLAAAMAAEREARLPSQFRAVPTASSVSRGDLAALIGVRLEEVVARAAPRPVVVTDVDGHWAAPWIAAVARAGVLPPFANHTFQPRAVVRRGDLAAAVSRLLDLMDPSIAAGGGQPEPLRIADMAPGHLSYPAVSAAVASGVLPLLDGGRFQVRRVVTGAEAVDAVDRLRAHAASSR